MGVGDGKRVNIPAPPDLKPGGRGMEGDQVIEFRGEATADPHHRKCRQEKPWRMLRSPYRKPTQVGG